MSLRGNALATYSTLPPLCTPKDRGKRWRHCLRNSKIRSEFAACACADASTDSSSLSPRQRKALLHKALISLCQTPELNLGHSFGGKDTSRLLIDKETRTQPV
jgi:hypothetical protein